MKFSPIFCLLGLLALATLASAGTAQREKRFLKSTFKKVKKFTTKTVDKVGDFADDAIDKTGDFAGDAIDKTGDFAEDVIDKTGDFAEDTYDDVKDIAKDGYKYGKKVGSGVAAMSSKYFKAAYKEAKSDFQSLSDAADKLPFSWIVDTLVDQIDGKLSNKLCGSTCNSGAASLLGDDVAEMSEVACPLLCKAVLAKIEDSVQKGVDKIRN